MFELLKNKLRYRSHINRLAAERRARRYARVTRELLDKAIAGVGVEAKETEEMAQSFFKLIEHKLKLGERTEPPTEEEVKNAIEQLKDVGRLSIFATISIIPGGGFSLIGLEVLAKKFGIKSFTFVPSSFRKKTEEEILPGSGEL